MSIHRAGLFRSGTSQAVRLPEEVTVEVEGDVFIVRSGDFVTICPARMTAAGIAEGRLALPAVSELERR